jgi:hypothetical protein
MKSVVNNLTLLPCERLSCSLRIANAACALGPSWLAAAPQVCNAFQKFPPIFPVLLNQLGHEL